MTSTTTPTQKLRASPVVRRGLGLGKQARRAEARGFKAPDPEQVKIRLAELRGYRWSSFRAYAGYCKIPGWLEVSELLRRAARLKDSRIPTYRRDVESRLKQGRPRDKVLRSQMTRLKTEVLHVKT